MSERIRLDRRFDWVGPPDKISKIRPIRLRKLAGEGELEREYREARERLNRWNSDFWTSHNTIFESKKKEFVEKKKAELGRIEQVTANDMSVFYQQFLNDRKQAMSEYNREWYSRNLALIWPALKVNMVRFQRLLLRK